MNLELHRKVWDKLQEVDYTGPVIEYFCILQSIALESILAVARKNPQLKTELLEYADLMWQRTLNAVEEKEAVNVG